VAVAAFWFNSWFDISQGPNLALFNHVRKNGADAETRDGQYVVIAPTLHCGFYRITDGCAFTVWRRLLKMSGHVAGLPLPETSGVPYGKMVVVKSAVVKKITGLARAPRLGSWCRRSVP
jgi:hypothetical protein